MERVLTASVPLQPTLEEEPGRSLFMNNSLQRTQRARRIFSSAIRHSLFAILLGISASSLFAVTPTPTASPTSTPTPTPTATPTPYPSTYADTLTTPGRFLSWLFRPGVSIPAFILVDEHGNPASLGGGGGGLTDTQLRATPVPVAQTGAQYTIAIAVATTDGSIAAGKHHIEMILSSDFVGTIQSAAIDPAILAVYSPGDAPVGSTFDGVTYTISAGNATITTW